MSDSQQEHHEHTEGTTEAQFVVLVTVYGRAGCVQCDATHLAPDRAGIAHHTIDLDTDAAAVMRLREAGDQQLPVVQTGTGRGVVTDPDQIRSLRDPSNRH